MHLLDLLNPFHEVHGLFSLITWLTFMFILLAVAAYVLSWASRWAESPRRKPPAKPLPAPPSTAAASNEFFRVADARAKAAFAPVTETWLDREPFTQLDLEVLDVGARRLYKKPWPDLVEDFKRIGRAPSADFVATIMLAGALAMAKQEDPDIVRRVAALRDLQKVADLIDEP